MCLFYIIAFPTRKRSTIQHVIVLPKRFPRHAVIQACATVMSTRFFHAKAIEKFNLETRKV